MPKAYYTFRCPKCNTGRKTEVGLLRHVEQCTVCRCPECRTRFGTVKALLDHLRETRHKSCQCGHVATTGAAFPHRPGTAGCESEPWDDLLNQPRGRLAKPSDPCPF